MNQLNDLQFTISKWASFLNKALVYLPVLGPVYSAGQSLAPLLNDLLTNIESEAFLFYDKNKRWYQKKPEEIILSAIEINEDSLCIPTKCCLPNNAIKIYYYSARPLSQADFIKLENLRTRLSVENAAEPGAIYCFASPFFNGYFSCHNIYLKIITKKDNLDFPSGIGYFSDLGTEAAQTFGLLSEEPELEGFDFLRKEFILQRKPLSPIICAVKNEKIIGAIGPLDIWRDPFNVPWLLPPYFGVKAKARNKGIGGKLWQAAMSFAYKNGAKYTLVQNKPNSPAAIFYEEQGLVNAGEVYSVKKMLGVDC